MTIRSYLQSHAVDFDFLLHRPTHSATHLAGSLHVPGGSVAKGVLIWAGDTFVLAVLPATHRVDIARLAEVLGVPDVRIATEAEVEQVFADCEAGAPPSLWSPVRFGHRARLEPGSGVGTDIYRQHEARRCPDALRRLRSDRSANRSAVFVQGEVGSRSRPANRQLSSVGPGSFVSGNSIRFDQQWNGRQVSFWLASCGRSRISAMMRPDNAGHEPRSMRCMEIRGGSIAVEEVLVAPGLDEWVYSRPHEASPGGGDVHYLSLCGGGIVSRLILADVSGHGAAVAEIAVALRSLIKKNINVKNQGRLIRDLNRQFAAIAQLDHFATAVVATYLATNHTLTISNAGHPRPLRRRSEDGSWDFLGETTAEPGNLPWGLDDDSPYHQFSISLGLGDVVLFYTDALIEAADPSGQLLGEAGLISLARGLSESDQDRVGPALLAAIATHRGGQEADDDVTLVTWKHNSTGPRHPSLPEKIETYAKVFGLKDY